MIKDSLTVCEENREISTIYLCLDSFTLNVPSISLCL